MRKLLIFLGFLMLCGLAHGQSCTFTGQFSATGQFVCPGTATAPPSFSSILFGMHVHSPTVTLPPIPFDALRLEGTSCLWNTITTAGPTYNFSCLAQWIGYGNQFNVDLVFTLGQVPTFLSTISTDPGPFPVAPNGAAITCQSNSCTATITTLQRMNAAIGDSLTVLGDDGSCPEPINVTATASAVTNNTDYPGWTYTFPIGVGSTNSAGCGGAGMTLLDNTQIAAGASRCGGTPAGAIQKGGCYSPADVNVDGTGNDCSFAAAAGPCVAGTGFLTTS